MPQGNYHTVSDLFAIEDRSNLQKLDLRYQYVRPDKYYIVDIRNPLKPQFFLCGYPTKQDAQYIIQNRLKEGARGFRVETGRDVIRYELDRIPFYIRKRMGVFRRTKYEKIIYDYPKHLKTRADRARFRNTTQHRLRNLIKKLENQKLLK